MDLRADGGSVCRQAIRAGWIPGNGVFFFQIFFYDDGGAMRSGAGDREVRALTCLNERSECRRQFVLCENNVHTGKMDVLTVMHVKLGMNQQNQQQQIAAFVTQDSSKKKSAQSYVNRVVQATMRTKRDRHSVQSAQKASFVQ